jgi:hypothetical protein
MSLKSINAMIGGNTGNRKKNDFYPTPKWAIDEILDRVQFSGPVWEPACGDGAISTNLIARGYDVRSTDLYDQGYGFSGFDFLKLQEPWTNIMTNPPFKLSTKFALHALNLVSDKVLLLNKLSFLEGSQRRDKLFSQRKLERVYIFGNRLNFDPESEGTGMMAFAWFLFNKKFDGEARIEWI